MQEFKNQVAVITGAASGIGLGIAIKCATEGMKIVLADIDGEALKLAEKHIKQITPNVISVITDTTNIESIENLAQSAIDNYGQVNLLVNNAGVGGPMGPIWDIPSPQLKWTLDVNLLGVINGIKVFVPIMKKQNTKCHIVNVSSHAGLTSSAHFTAYQITKHAVVTLTESLQQDLIAYNCNNINASVFIPFFVQSKISDTGRYFTQRNIYISDEAQTLVRQLSVLTRRGITPQAAADILFAGIKENNLYIFTNEQTKLDFQQRANNILGKNI